MSRTILNYNLYITYNDQKTNLSLSEVIDKIILLSHEKRFWDEGKLSLLYLKAINIKSPYTMYDRSFAIAKYRDSYKPYTGKIGTDQAVPIEEDVIEFTCCAYIEPSKQLLIEYNHTGARPNDIAKYFASFLPNNEKDNSWGICLEPINSENGLNKVNKAKKINSIEFKIDCTKTLPVLNGNTFFSIFLQQTVKSHQEFGANIATIKFGSGRKKLEIIEAKQLINLVSMINIEDEIFVSVKVEYINEHGDKKKMDLKKENILKHSIMEEDDSVTGYEYIIDQIDSMFIERHKPGYNACENYVTINDAKLPEFKILSQMFVIGEDESASQIG